MNDEKRHGNGLFDRCPCRTIKKKFAPSNTQNKLQWQGGMSKILRPAGLVSPRLPHRAYIILLPVSDLFTPLMRSLYHRPGCTDFASESQGQAVLDQSQDALSRG